MAKQLTLKHKGVLITITTGKPIDREFFKQLNSDQEMKENYEDARKGSL